MNNHCPICNSKDHKIVGEARTNKISADFMDRDYSVVQCGRCSLYFVSPDIDFTAEQWSGLYNSEYFAIQSDWLIRKRAEEMSERFDRAESLLGANKGITFLDIGTGEGKTLIEGSKRGWDVTGIDIVDHRIEDAKKNGIKFIQAYFLEHNFKRSSFDFIYLDSVLEHVLDPKEYLSKIKTILKPGGIVYIGVPNEDCLFNTIRFLVFKIIGRGRISAKIKPFVSPYHVVGFNEASLKFLVNMLDMQIKDFRNIGRRFNFLSLSPRHRGFWINLIFLFPIELLGNLLKRDVYYALFLAKPRD